MAHPSSLLTIAIATILLTTSPPPLAAAVAPSRRPFNKIYAFGDSYTDTGNTASATGPSGFSYVSSPPYGTTFFHRPTNRYSDGRLVIDFVTQSLSLPFLPPYLDRKADKSLGVNFAVAGSTAIRHSFFVRNNLTLNITPQSLGTQLLWFEKFLEGQGCKGAAATPRECGEAIGDTLFWVGEIGANDYAYTIGSPIQGSTIQTLAIRSVTGFLQALLTKGAKYVVVQGLPTTGCLPLAMLLSPEDDRDSLGCVGTVNKQSFDHNMVLQSKLVDLRRQFPDAVVVYADFWNAYREVMKSPAKYGFREPFKACCGSGGDPYNFLVFAACGSPSATACQDPYEYINWDGVHLTEGMYKVVADLLINGAFSHPPFQYLLRRKQGEEDKMF